MGYLVGRADHRLSSAQTRQECSAAMLGYESTDEVASPFSRFGKRPRRWSQQDTIILAAVGSVALLAVYISRASPSVTLLSEHSACSNPDWGQCGGKGFNGDSCCAQDSKCVFRDSEFSQWYADLALPPSCPQLHRHPPPHPAASPRRATLSSHPTRAQTPSGPSAAARHSMGSGAASTAQAASSALLTSLSAYRRATRNSSPSAAAKASAARRAVPPTARASSATAISRSASRRTRAAPPRLTRLASS